MNIRTVVTVMTTALLSVSLASMSSAQDNIGSAQDGIEVITIIGKRPAPAVATACMNAATARTDAAAEHQNGDSNFSDVLESRPTSISSPQRTIKRCDEQTAFPVEAQI